MWFEGGQREKNREKRTERSGWEGGFSSVCILLIKKTR